jgi:general secretion pathway protein K
MTSSPRRGIALLAALWLIVAIAAVSVQFGLAARERRLLGLAGADRARERAVAAGALATMQARMDYDLRNRVVGRGAAALRSSDPWLDVDSIYSGVISIDSIPVQVVAKDLGTMLFLNQANNEVELRTFFSFVLGNYTAADQLAQSIMDWRDIDETPRVLGAEREQYLKDDLLALPTNGPLREVDDLIHIRGMTPDVLELIRPYLTTFGTGAAGTGTIRVNINSAPEVVLRALPGMTDAILLQIMSQRSQGRRIESVQQVISAASRGASGAQQQQNQRTQEALTNRTSVDTQNVLLTFYVSLIPKAQPTRLVALITRGGNNATLTWQLW